MRKRRSIVLASSSPRRSELLALAGLRFVIDPADYEEDMHGRIDPRALARHLSRQKAAVVAPRHADALVIAADTFIVYQGRLMGKPRTKKEAGRMLMKLSGTTHTVVTGFTVMDTATMKTVSRSEATQVSFRRLTAGEIDLYVRSGEPLDKAGAYAIQGWAALFVRKIEGDFFNVIGLPLCSLSTVLKRFGVALKPPALSVP